MALSVRFGNWENGHVTLVKKESGCILSGTNSTGIMAATVECNYRILKEGWLKKKGSKVHLWTERYFVLLGSSLYYFAKSTDVVR